MTPQAANELIDVLMLEDLVERRRALDKWVERWTSTLEIVHTADAAGVAALNREFPGKADLVAKIAICAKMVEGLIEDECNAVTFEKFIGDKSVVQYRVRLRVVTTQPREPDDT